MYIVYHLFLVIGVMILIAGLGWFAHFIKRMTDKITVAWGEYFILISLSAILMVLGLLMTLHYYPLTAA